MGEAPKGTLRTIGHKEKGDRVQKTNQQQPDRSWAIAGMTGPLPIIGSPTPTPLRSLSEATGMILRGPVIQLARGLR